MPDRPAGRTDDASSAGSGSGRGGRARTIFLGSGRFALPAVDALSAHPSVDLVAVVTAPPRPAGRRREPATTPVGDWAAENAVPTLTPMRLRSPDAVAAVGELRPELIVLADYGQIVPGEVLSLPPHGALNLHPSLLPRHRGASPIAAAILAGDGETGVTIILMDEGLDTGAIVAQRRVRLRGDETAPELEERLAREAADLLAATLPDWLAGSLAPTPQPDGGATLTRPLRREDGRLDPSRPAVELERQVRALLPWPGSFLETAQGRLVVWKAEPVELGASGEDEQVGTLVAEGEGLALVTSRGALRLLEVQPAGGRRMTGSELLRGRPALAGSRALASGVR